MIKICEACRLEYEPSHSTQKICDECKEDIGDWYRVKAQAKKLEDSWTECVNCGEGFYRRSRKDQITCSSKCYREHKMTIDPEYAEKYKKNFDKWVDSVRKKTVCKIIYQHEKDYANDPEALSTEFIEKMVGMSCEKLKKEKRKKEREEEDDDYEISSG